MTILADHKKLIYSGRIDWSNPLEPIFVFPCTFVKMKFTGNVLKVHVKNQAMLIGTIIWECFWKGSKVLFFFRKTEKHCWIFR